jgi:hypothetical protein
MSAFDFTMPGSLAAAFVTSLGVPIYLLLLARAPLLAGRNALQFFAAVMIAAALWGAAALAIPAAQPTGGGEFLLGVMVLGSVFLLYLEVWALLSRGYTLGLVITIHHAGRPLSAAELTQHYRRGQGLQWIMRHRLAGLAAARLVRREGPFLVLTPRLGRAVAWSYRLAIAALGLKATG